MKYIRANAKRAVKQHSSFPQNMIWAADNRGIYLKTLNSRSSQAVRRLTKYKSAYNTKTTSQSYDNLLNTLKNFSDDFMNERIQIEADWKK